MSGLAYSNNYSSSRNSGQRSGNQRQNHTYQEPKELPKPEKLPEDYVDQAEAIMQHAASSITTSKIRNLLSLVSDIYNTENLRSAENLLPESESALLQMRIRVAYECGRDEGTRTFVEKAKLLQYLKGIGHSRAELIRFAHYMEALVAYHRYFGGRES